MATASPAPPTSEITRPAMQLAVLFGPEITIPYPDGTPNKTHEVDWLIVDRITLGSGGQRDDVIAMHVDMTKARVRLQDTTTPKNMNRQVEIRVLDEDNKPTRIICWGFLSRQGQTLNDAEEGLRLEARLDKFAYGNPFTSYPVYDDTHGLTEIHGSPALGNRNAGFVFNPEIDDIIEGNMSDKVRQTGDLSPSEPATWPAWHYPIDPESMRTAAARDVQFQERSLWSIGEAVFFLCWWLNPDEDYISNPPSSAMAGLSFAELEDTTLIRNVEIPFGVHLPDALDALLTPLGYGWYRHYELVEETEDDETTYTRKTSLRLFKRGTGMQTQLRVQRAGELISNKKTNVSNYAAEFSLVDLANHVIVYGNYIGIESTWELMPGWEEDEDELFSIEELGRDQPNAIGNPWIGRKWVLDLDGSMVGKRTGHTAPEDLETLFGHVVSFKRRKFEKCLSKHTTAEDAESNGVRVDWYDETATGAIDPDVADDPGWVKVPWPFSLLHKEAGIVFSQVPNELYQWFYEAADPTKARVRITATIRGDRRIKGEAVKRDASPNGMDLPLVLYLPEKFEKTSVDAASIFSGDPSDARDDSTAITNYATTLRNVEDCAEISCSVALDGADHPEYVIGNLVTALEGRNLTLNAFALGEGATTRYPQIVGFNYTFAGGQYTETLLESFKQERPEV